MMFERATFGAQITLGQLIDGLEAASSDEVCFDFGGLAPTSIDSYRGFYEHLALGHTKEAYEYKDRKALLAELHRAAESVFEGYKGGYYRMSRDTPVWVANYGESTSTAVIGVRDTGYVTMILTGHEDV